MEVNSLWMAIGEPLLRPRAVVILSLVLFVAHSFRGRAVASGTPSKGTEAQSCMKVSEGEFAPKLFLARAIRAPRRCKFSSLVAP